MSSHSPCLLSTTTLLLSLILICLHFSPVSCLVQPQQPSASPQGSLFEEKTRLGSTPPSCHNKCNSCHPCMAFPVPTQPNHHSQAQPGFTNPVKFFYPFATNNNSKYSNYKPLGWKCRCGDHFYNP